MGDSKVLLAAAICIFLVSRGEAERRIAMVSLDGSEGSLRAGQAVGQTLGNCELFVRDRAARPEVYLDPEKFSLVVLLESRTVPGGLAPALPQFFRRNGNLLALGGPPFEDVRWLNEGQWVTADEYLAQRLKPEALVDLGKLGEEAWRRSSSHPQVATRWAIEGQAPDGSAALTVNVPELSGWDNVTLAEPGLVFPKGHTYTCLWVRATGDPGRLLVEWQEKDGSRWIGSVAVGPEWRRVFLAPQDFRYWPDNPSRGRGGANDRLNVGKVARLSIGLAQSHGARLGGPYMWQIGGISTAPPPEALPQAEFPHLELLYPWYKHFTMEARAADLVQPYFTQTAISADLDCALVSPVPRPAGLGLGHEQEGRFIQVARASGKAEMSEGSACSAFVSLAEETRGACWGLMGLAAERIAESTWLREALKATVEVMLQPVLLATGGTREFNYFEDETVSVGAEVLVREPVNDELAIEVGVSPEESPQVLISRSFRVSGNQLGRLMAGTFDIPAGQLAPGFYECVCSLSRDGQVVDRIRQPFTVSERKPRRPRQFVKVEDGQFMLEGKPWYPHGVNFWPGYVAGQEPGRYWGHWLRPASYDPARVEADLGRLAACGGNMVSIQLTTLEQVPCARDFLMRCARHGIKANVFVPGGHPLHPEPAKFVELIKAGGFADNDTIFAWDLAWEPNLGDYNARRFLDRDWERWLDSRYGGVENAERDFGMPAPRDAEGRITGPSQEQILNDGPWRVLVAAYRRFVDDRISKGYNQVVRALREVDPHHLAGVRTGYGGTGGQGVDPRMPFDLVAGAKHLDFISPEGYNLSGPWEEFRGGGFTTAYARWAGNGKPVFWAEFGRSVHPQPDAARIEAQRDLYDKMYGLVLESGADGSAGWWFPGGYRVNEDSDYGVFNPDGSPRPAALEMKRFAAQVTSPRPVREPEVWIEIDRDLHPRGYSMVLARHREEYAAAVRAGKAVGVRTAGTGKTSADVPLVAVGNVPCRGSNPPKYLNAEFNWLRILNSAGKWVEVGDGDEVEIRRAEALTIHASLGNTGEATWVPGGEPGTKEGAVYLVVDDFRDVAHYVAIPHEVTRYGDVEIGPIKVGRGVDGTQVRFDLEAYDRTRFGEAITVRVVQR